MRARPKGAPKLTKAQKKKMRRQWKKERIRKAKIARGDILPGDYGYDPAADDKQRNNNNNNKKSRRRKRNQANEEPAGDKGWGATACGFVVELMKARGWTVRRIGKLLGNDWTGEQTQRVMILYGHIFSMAMISNVFSAEGEANQANLNDSVGGLLSIILAITAVLSLVTSMHRVLAWQGILFGISRLVFASGVLPGQLASGHERDM